MQQLHHQQQMQQQEQQQISPVSNRASQYLVAETEVSEELKQRLSSKSPTYDIRFVLETIGKLEQEIRNSEEARIRLEEEFASVEKNMQESSTIVKIVEANLKLKSFALETIRQKLGSFLLSLGESGKKVKVDKIKEEVLSLQEQFLKLKTEFEVQMKWIATSLSPTEINKKPLDLTLIPQTYRHMIINNNLNTIKPKPMTTPLNSSSSFERRTPLSEVKFSTTTEEMIEPPVRLIMKICFSFSPFLLEAFCCL
jgi:hypothetical protein